MSKLELNRSIPPEEFNWEMYEDGYDGGNSLKVNKKIKTKGKDQVFSHEPYAQELYDVMEAHYSGQDISDWTPKDVISGRTYGITNMIPVGDHEVIIETATGGGGKIDLTKEKPFIEAHGLHSVNEFIAALHSADYRKELLDTKVCVKAFKGGRLSLWDGHLSKVEQEFREQILADKNPEIKRFAYNAYIESINGGGYIAIVQGVRCFLPGSLAAAGLITDFASMVGKTIPVMIVNYVPRSGFVVSYKKYLAAIMPTKIENELSIGMRISGKITGFSTNGIFVSFKDVNGEPIFSGLVHRSGMSADLEKAFDLNKQPYGDDLNESYMKLEIGDEMPLYISNFIEKKGETRIILSDKNPVTKKKAAQEAAQEAE